MAFLRFLNKNNNNEILAKEFIDFPESSSVEDLTKYFYFLKEKNKKDNNNNKNINNKDDDINIIAKDNNNINNDDKNNQSKDFENDNQNFLFKYKNEPNKKIACLKQNLKQK